LRNCGSQILKIRNRSSATFLVRNSEINMVVRNIAELRRCGLKLRMPTFAKSSYATSDICVHTLCKHYCDERHFSIVSFVPGCCLLHTEKICKYFPWETGPDS
jgi:hypothetical protein